MAQPATVMCDVWRQACRHIEIGDSLDAIADIVGASLPAATFVVLGMDPAAHSVETIAVSAARDGAVAPRTGELPGPVWKKLGQWLQSGSLTPATGDHAWLQAAFPAGVQANAVAAPLRADGRPLGLLVIAADPATPFSPAHLDVAADLVEPLAAALDNDSRFHELRSLREAAEADRRSLLSRLGRQAVNEDVVGSRTGLKHVMERVELVAASDVPVLILGETGTGKEVVSRAIHTRSRRSEGPFIRVNCGAIPAELIDSQLFGHEKGSFTGASEQHHGWFERADRGTLFLDEIGELPLPAQVRLLRVLQDHQIERVGGRSPVHVDVRIVAATHRDLAAMVKDKTFREDLWYRINVFPIRLPTLRERLEDIPALVGHFARRAASRFGLPPVEPTAADVQLLSSYDWPGNIRELGAVIDRAAILGGGRSLEVAAALGLGRQVAVPRAPATETGGGTTSPTATDDPDAAAQHLPAHGIEPLETAMRRHIERALAATQGRIEGPRGAAAILKINPHTLRARMRKLRVDPARFRP